MAKVFEFPYRTVAEVSLSRVIRNLVYLRSYSRKEVIPVIKADAYGHGMIPIAKVLLSRGSCTMLAVATLEEAIELRKYFNRPFGILVLSGFLPHQLGAYFTHGLTPMIYSLNHLKAFLGQKQVPEFHLKLDTGMGRLGLRPEQMDEAFFVLKRLSTKISGLATHFAESENLESPFIEEQLVRFEYWYRRLLGEKLLHTDARIHVCNSAALMRMKGKIPFATSVRPGLTIYGLSPAPNLPGASELVPALQWKTRIIAIKEINPGESVGYGRRYYAKTRERIAILPVGYADGYPRILSNRAEVLISGVRARIRGAISMDMMAVDCTSIDAREGHSATLIGQDGEEQILPNELAVRADTIPYEILCGISGRVPRIYFDSEST